MLNLLLLFNDFSYSGFDLGQGLIDLFLLLTHILGDVLNFNVKLYVRF
jgi:hypothetical protein